MAENRSMPGEKRINPEHLTAAAMVRLAELADPARQAEAVAARRRSWLRSLAKKTPEELEVMAADLEQKAADVWAAAKRARRR